MGSLLLQILLENPSPTSHVHGAGLVWAGGGGGSGFTHPRSPAEVAELLSVYFSPTAAL